LHATFVGETKGAGETDFEVGKHVIELFDLNFIILNILNFVKEKIDRLLWITDFLVEIVPDVPNHVLGGAGRERKKEELLGGEVSID
jgi:hypothetical protein